MRQILTQRTPTTHPFGLPLDLTKSRSPGLQAKFDNPIADRHQTTAISRQPMGALSPLSAALVLCIVCSISQSVVAQITLTNPTSIAEGGSADVNPCSPYPSGIAVSGLPGLLTKVTVTVKNLYVDDPPDANILLVGPNGQNVILMSDAPGDRTGVINKLTLTFDDAALSPLPSDLTLMSGSYKPTNFDSGNDFFPAPAPAGPYGATLSVFNGSNPNGTWGLYVVNNKGNHPWDYGTVWIPGGWSLTITASTQSPPVNPIDDTQFFVRQHYLDFLSREPEVGEPWSGVLNNCSDVNNNPACDRLTVSAAFLGSPEFQLKGYFVYRFYKLAFNRLPTYSEIVTDMRAVTGQTPNEVFQKKEAFTSGFVQRAEFMNGYDTVSNAQYVTTLLDRYSLTQVTTPDPAAPDGTDKVTLTSNDLINRLSGIGGALTHGQVLRAIADSDQVFNAEFNRAFVAMQYYGYLRRAPEPAGYDAWLNYLNANPTDSRTMVNGFMNSVEYRKRFGQP